MVTRTAVGVRHCYQQDLELHLFSDPPLDGLDATLQVQTGDELWLLLRWGSGARQHRRVAPVRWGNDAVDHVQHDVYGEILDCAHQWVARGGTVDDALWADSMRPPNYSRTYALGLLT
jgi:hypothetical protein